MSTRLYVGRLPRADERDLEHFFKGYGRIAEIRIMSGFAFVEMEDPRDARDAVQDLSGKTLLGERVSVEFAKPPRRRDDDRGGRFDDYRDDRRGGGDRYDRGPERPLRFARPRRTGFRAIVENLEASVSWQDLKDFARTAGEVTFADCHSNGQGTGAIEFAVEADLQAAVNTLDGQELKGQPVKLRIDPDATAPFDDGAGRRPPSRSYRDRSRSRSPPGYGGRGGGDRRGGRSPSPYDRRRRDDSPPRRRREYSPPPRRRDDSRDRYGGGGDRDRERERSPRRDRSPPRGSGPVLADEDMPPVARVSPPLEKWD